MVNGIINAAPSYGRNAMRYSKLYAFERNDDVAKGIALKFVMRGEEIYETPSQCYTVRAGNYLLLNERSAFNTLLKEGQLNVGICIDLDRNLLQHAFDAFVFEKDGFARDENRSGCSFEIIEGIYTGNDALGKLLWKIGAEAMDSGGRVKDFNGEIYNVLARHLVSKQLGLHNEMNKITAQKPSVQKEIYRRVSLARQHIHDHIGKNISVNELASLSQMSLFHFIRSFRQAIGISPHQYVIQARLQYAMDLLKDHRLPVKDIAIYCGFTDIHSFSKAFKKKYGVSPARTPFRMAAEKKSCAAAHV